MIGVRYEKYGTFENNCPFSLAMDLVRTKYHCSKEQNWHKNIEIQLFTSGVGTVLLDGKAYDVLEGDILVVNSDAMHYTYTESSITYTCLIVSTDWCDAMGISYDSLDFSPVIKSSALVEKLQLLVQTYSAPDVSLRTAKLNELFLQIMIELVECHAQPLHMPPPKSKNFAAVKKAVAYIKENYERKITLDALSKEVFYDKYALCKAFKKYTGQTIVENLNQYRILKAKELLQRGYCVSEAAFLCGFENLSFFTRTFKKYTGHTPSFFRGHSDLK